MSAAAAVLASSEVLTTIASARTTIPKLDILRATQAKSTHNFIIPTILITPPDEQPRYSMRTPEQTYDKAVLFVPVNTEELGWDEHGLYWNGTYAYPVHQIYDKEGQPIGRRRKGPHGYRFEEYFHGKKPRRRFEAPYPAEEIEMIDSEIQDPYMEAEADHVEEACVRLTEPAPARIDGSCGSDSQKGTTSIPSSAEETSIDAEPASVPSEVDDAVGSPVSPTMSLMSDCTETEDSSSFCDDASSLWSSNDLLSDDEESICSSTGDLSPPTSVKESVLDAEVLSNKLADIDSPQPAADSSSRPWLPLGKLPSSTASPSRSASLPTRRVNSKAAMDFSQSHRARSTCVVPPTQSGNSHRRSASVSAYTSIIEDLTKSPLEQSSASSAALSSSPLQASSTFSRSTSRMSFSSSGSKSRSSSILRPPSFMASTLPRSSASRRTFEPELSAGWMFEAQSSKLTHSWQQNAIDD